MRYNNLAIALLKKGQVQDAIAAWTKALQLQPKNADMHNNLAVALLQRGRRCRGRGASGRKHSALQPDKIGTQITLAWILSTSPDAGDSGWNQSARISRSALSKLPAGAT